MCSRRLMSGKRSPLCPRSRSHASGKMTATPRMTTGASSTAFRRGDVLLVPFPFSDLSTTKTRPAVLVSIAEHHANEPDRLLAALTSQLANATGPCDYVLTEWQPAGLRFPTAHKPVFFTLHPARVLHRIGALSSADFAQ